MDKLMNITLKIERLEVRACLGVLPLEKRVAQDFEVSMTLELPYDGSDRIEATANYAEACGIAREEMQRGGDLIENAAARIAAALRRRWPQLLGGSVTVGKLQPPMPYAVARVSATVRL